MNNKRFKAIIMKTTTHWTHKVIARRVEGRDALVPRFKHFLTIFIPKLTPTFQKPCVFLHTKSGNSSCLMRFEHPIVLADLLEQLSRELRSNKWLDTWDSITETSDALIVDRLMVNEDNIDIELFKEQEKSKLENTEE
jgi:hypothetical protein